MIQLAAFGPPYRELFVNFLACGGLRNLGAPDQAGTRGPGHLGLLQRLAMLADVEAHDFVLMAHPQRNHRTDDLEDDERHRAGPQRSDGDPIELGQQLVRIAFEQA